MSLECWVARFETGWGWPSHLLWWFSEFLFREEHLTWAQEFTVAPEWDVLRNASLSSHHCNSFSRTFVPPPSVLSFPPWSASLYDVGPGWRVGKTQTPWYPALSLCPSSANIFCVCKPPFWHQGLVSWENFSMNRVGVGDSFRMIRVHYIYCALYYYDIVISNWKVRQLTIIQNQWEPWACFPKLRR